MLERFEKFSLAIVEISRFWHKIAGEELAKYGLKSSHITYLLTLYRYPEGLTAPKLAELCGRDKADVSRMVTILEKKGLVRKQTVDGKLYRAKLLLTEEGKKAARHVRQRAAVAVELAGAGLSDKNREVFYEALEQITKNLQTLSREGIPSNEEAL